MIEEINELLAAVPRDGAIYLAKQLSENTGFFIANGHLLYLVYNFENIAHKSLLTDYLLLNTDVEIHSFKNNQIFTSGKYNVLDFLPTESGYAENNLESFLNLCISHTKFMGGKSFVDFFFSLSELFQEPKEQQYKNLVGLFGELTFIKHMCKIASLDLSDRWHNGGSQDKYEITLNRKNIEIKTTSAVDEEVTIKHSQLFNGDQNYLAVVCIETSTSGTTLNQLIASMQSDPVYYNNYNFVLNIEREKKRVSPIDANTKRFSLKSVAVFNTDGINPFEAVPESVSELTYKLDLIGEKDIPENQWSKEFST